MLHLFTRQHTNWQHNGLYVYLISGRPNSSLYRLTKMKSPRSQHLCDFLVHLDYNFSLVVIPRCGVFFFSFCDWGCVCGRGFFLCPLDLNQFLSSHLLSFVWFFLFPSWLLSINSSFLFFCGCCPSSNFAFVLTVPPLILPSWLPFLFFPSCLLPLVYSFILCVLMVLLHLASFDLDVPPFLLLPSCLLALQSFSIIHIWNPSIPTLTFVFSDPPFHIFPWCSLLTVTISLVLQRLSSPAHSPLSSTFLYIFTLRYESSKWNMLCGICIAWR